MDSKYKYVVKTLTFEGKRYYVRGKSEQEAIRKLGSLEAELKSGTKVLNQKTTVQKWAKEWMEVYVKSKNITPKSVEMYKQKLDNYILPEIGTMRLCDVRDTHLKKLLNKANSSFSTAQKVKIVMQALFKQARKSRLIQYDPSEDIEIPKTKKGTHRSINEVERTAILEVAEYHYAGLYVLLVLYCGLRPGEAIALQWKDIDVKKHLIYVRKALESGRTGEVKSPKSDAGNRDIPIPDVLWPKLLAARKGLFEPVLIQPLGRKIHSHSSIGDAWNNFKRELDIHMGAEVYRNQIIQSIVAPDLVPYCLRHTYCTDLQRAGVPLNVAKYLMGHSDVSVTGNIYTDTTPDVINFAAAKMNNFYRDGRAESQTEDEMNLIADELL